jgi:hypothetical protein
MYASYGWQATLLTGMAFPGLALLYWLGELLPVRARRTA